MARPKVLVFSQSKGLLQQIRKNLPNELKKINIDEIEESDTALTDDSLARLEATEVLVGDPGLIAKHKLLYKLPNLKWMQSTWAGVDGMLKNVDPNKPLPQFVLSRFAGYFGNHMAEFVVGQIIAHERGFAQLNKYQQNKQWPGLKDCKEREYRLLSQLSIGILGVGSIGKEVARACKAFGMGVHGLVRNPVTPQTQCPHVDVYRQYDGLGKLLAECDYICNLLPSTPTTKGLLNGNVLAVTQKKPVFINIGRGDIISEETILQALKEGWLSHAVLDVFEKEPLPSSSALWHHPNVTITPHLSGVSFSWQVAELFCKNLEKYVSNEPVEFIVNWDEGY